jgi:hypothetical protein
MHLEFLVEEPSAEAALSELLPRLIGQDGTFRVHPHQGKRDLLESLPGKLKGYSNWLPSDWRIVVLVDLDGGDCKKVKAKLEKLARNAKLTTKSSATGRSRPQVLNRIAIEELEAWFFGDVEALCTAYPGVPRTLAAKSGFRDPDKIRGGTWERLEQVLQKAGHFKGGLAKIAAAREIAKHMQPDRNRSRSFTVFRDGIRALLAI